MAYHKVVQGIRLRFQGLPQHVDEALTYLAFADHNLATLYFRTCGRITKVLATLLEEAEVMHRCMRDVEKKALMKVAL